MDWFMTRDADDLRSGRPTGRPWIVRIGSRLFEAASGRGAVAESRQRILDVLIVAGAVAFEVVAAILGDESVGAADAAVRVPLSAVAIGALLVRRRHPVPVAAIALAARVALVAVTSSSTALLPVVVVALFSAARNASGRRDLLIVAPLAIGAAVLVAAFDSDAFAVEIRSEAVEMILPIALGDALRSRDARLRARIEAEASARVQAERLRIARDLHDITAHGLSTIAIQSGVAAHLLDPSQAQAREALQAINTTGRKALDDLRAMVGALRSDSPDPRPTPADPDDLTDVIAGATAAGVTPRPRIDGSFPPTISDAVVVAVHRIIQEALTNVARHAGPVPADVHLSHGESSVEVTVSNGPGPGSRSAAVPSTGVGIVGMTERAALLGGTLRAQPRSDGGFLVSATIPYWRDDA